jgi:hypothetical protein
MSTNHDNSPGIPVSSTNKTDHHDITEILLKVALSTITLTQNRKKITNDMHGLYQVRNTSSHVFVC